MLISFCLKLSFSALNSLNHSAFLSCSVSLSHVTPKLFTLFSIWFFIIDISYTIHDNVDKIFSNCRQKFCWSYTGSLSPHISSVLLSLNVPHKSLFTCTSFFLFEVLFNVFKFHFCYQLILPYHSCLVTEALFCYFCAISFLPVRS